MASADLGHRNIPCLFVRYAASELQSLVAQIPQDLGPLDPPKIYVPLMPPRSTSP